MYNRLLNERLPSFSVYNCVVNSCGAFCIRRETGCKSTCFFQHFFKASLNIFILKLYTNGFTIEFAKCKTFTNHSNVWEKQSQQNALMVYTTKPGNQKISNTATTTWNVFERRKFWSRVDRLWPSCKSGFVAYSRERIDK